MASLSLPFSLTRPSPTEGVTDASEIDDKIYNKSQHAINVDLYAKLANGGGGNGSGLGHISIDTSYSVVILDSSQTFSSQVISDNTIYVIQDEYDLGGQIVWMKNNTTLWFYGGCIKNGCLKNMKEGRNGYEWYKTTIFSSFNKVCFSDIVLVGKYLGTAYDFMFKDTQREDDYLIFHNLVHCEHGEIVEKKQLNITTWLNPYNDTYSITSSKSSKGILLWSGFYLDGHGATLNILMDDDEKMEQCGAWSESQLEDGSWIVYGVMMSAPFIRFHAQMDAGVNGNDNDMTIKNLQIYDDKERNGKGADLTKWDLTLYHNKSDKTITTKSHSNFITRGGNKLGAITFEDVTYRGRFQVCGSTHAIGYTCGSLPDVHLTRCNMYVINYFILELFTSEGSVGHRDSSTGEWIGYNEDRYGAGVAYGNVYYNNCTFKGTGTLMSNGATLWSEIWNNCTIDSGVTCNEHQWGVFYQFNNCVFKGGSMPVNGNQNICTIEVNNCVMRLDNMDKFRIGESGYTLRAINGAGETTYNHCSFLMDYRSDEDYIPMLSTQDRATENQKLSFIDCNFVLKGMFGFNKGRLSKGSIYMCNCKLLKNSGTLMPFPSAHNMVISNIDGNYEFLKTNPRTIHLGERKNDCYSENVVGWNYLTPPTNAIVANNEVVSYPLGNISMCNGGLEFNGGRLSITMLIDFPVIDYTIIQPMGEKNFYFTFTLGDYKVDVVNMYGYSGLTLTITNTVTNKTRTLTMGTMEGLHNYTFTLFDENSPVCFIDDNRTTIITIQGFDDGDAINVNKANVINPKLHVGKVCGVKQIIVRPMAII